MKKLGAAIASIACHEDVNFLLSNRIPRRLATQVFGWFSRIEQPLVRDVSIGLWRRFADLNLHEAREARFRSLHDCFIRQLKQDARSIDPDPDVLVSPCDAIVGACGLVQDGQVLQIKGMPYRVTDLLGDAAAAERYQRGSYVTLRLTSSMYHRFHAPHDGTVEAVTYISGDTWNVNPIALKRVERLFCRNERAAIRLRLARGGHVVTLVPVAAILVASIRLHCLGADTPVRQGGPRTTQVAAVVAKGVEMGWFEHGSTIIVFAPAGFGLATGVGTGQQIKVGQPLMQFPPSHHPRASGDPGGPAVHLSPLGSRLRGNDEGSGNMAPR